MSSNGSDEPVQMPCPARACAACKKTKYQRYEGLRPVRYISNKYLISGADQNVKLVLNPLYTVKPVLRGHSKIDKRNILMTNGSLIKVESIAECSLRAFCNIFDLH